MKIFYIGNSNIKTYFLLKVISIMNRKEAIQPTMPMFFGMNSGLLAYKSVSTLYLGWCTTCTVPAQYKREHSLICNCCLIAFNIKKFSFTIVQPDGHCMML